MASIDVLKRALAANGLPTSGNKDQMLNRLMSGEPDKRKSKQHTLCSSPHSLILIRAQGG